VSAAVLAPEPSAGRSRRILLVESNEDGTVGGSYQAQFDLARLLDRAGFQPVVLFNQDNLFVARLRALGIEVHIFEAERAVERAAYGSGQKSRKFREMGRAILRRRRFLQGRHIDLLHLNNHPSFTCYDWLPAARLAGIPCVVNAMGDAEDDRLVSRALMRRYDRVIAISEFMRGRMLELGIPDRRITTVYLGLDAQAYRARVRRSPSEVRQELGVPADRVLVVMVGNLKFWKGQHVVLEALAGLPGDLKGRLTVLFVGATAPMGESYAESLRDTVRREGLEDVARFVGSRQDVPDLVNAADICLHASVMPEPFGLVVLEAMALGRPMIAARIGGPAEILTPESGLVFDPAQPAELTAALSRLATDRLLRERIGQAALRRVEEFSLERNVAGNVQVYRELLSE
jgi:glycosyltransferase involved in cell wall biosynthesis